MKKALAMKCTQEQWDSIKDRIPKEIKTHIRSFDNNNVLVNNWEGMGIVSNCCPEHSRILKSEYFSTFNAKIFLEACGIETDVFEITKKQVLELSKMNCVIKEKLCDLFPGAFKNELEIGKWYKSLEYPKQIVFVVGFETVQRIKGYGFDARGNWEKDNNHFSLGLPIDGNFEESTPQEVEAALISEWKKRGGKNGVYFNEIPDGKNNPSISQTGHCGSAYKYEDGVLYTTGRGKWCIYKDGVFATIIEPEKMTLEQIEKELGRKIEIV